MQNVKSWQSGLHFLALNPFNFRIKVQWVGRVTDRSLLAAHCLVCVFAQNLVVSLWETQVESNPRGRGRLLLPLGNCWAASRGSLRRCLVWQGLEQQCWQLIAEKGWEAAESFSGSGKDGGREQVTNGTKNCPGLKGTEQSWLQLWVTELKVQPSTEKHNGFVQGKELGLNHYLCFFFLLITLRFKYRRISSFHSNSTGHCWLQRMLWSLDAQSGVKTKHIYLETHSARSHQCEWKWLTYEFGMGSIKPDIEIFFLFPFHFSDWTTIRAADCLC